MNLPIQIDKTSGIPLYVQMEQQIRFLIRQGTLNAGDPMPTVRSLAVALAVNYNTAARVYRDLQQAGFLVLKRGIGTFVAQGASTKPVQGEDLAHLEHAADELIRLGRRLQMTAVDVSQLIETRWKEKGALMGIPSGMADSLDPGVTGLAAAGFRLSEGHE